MEARPLEIGLGVDTQDGEHQHAPKSAMEEQHVVAWRLGRRWAGLGWQAHIGLGAQLLPSGVPE